MTNLLTWFDVLVSSIPISILEVWGRFAYIIGLFMAISAFGGFTFRIGDRWGFGRARQTWDAKAFLNIPLTFVLIIVGGYTGSFIVLVPGAQTFKSLKDLVVLLCIVLFGYPALIAVPPAYMLSDLIEGVPPNFVLDWAEGYFFWTAFVWMAYQLIGRNPDFRQAKTWRRYGVFVAMIMLLDPVMWGYICSGQFTSAISYRNISPALASTLTITWILAPVAFLIALPLAKRSEWFWAEIAGHVRERSIGSSGWHWESGRNDVQGPSGPIQNSLPIRILIFIPFIGLMLLMVGSTAIVALRNADKDAARMATKFHQAMSANIRLRLDDHLLRSSQPAGAQRAGTLDPLLRSHLVGADGRVLILDGIGKVIASSAPVDDPVVEKLVSALTRFSDPSGLPAAETEFQFEHVSANPLSRETWLAYATTYRYDGAGHDWTLVMAMPESTFLAGLYEANSRTAAMFALALVLSLLLAAVLASIVTLPLQRLAQATRAMAHGDLGVSVPGSKLEELDVLAESFNAMAARLQKSFDDLIGEVETRKGRENELKESEAHLRVSEERLQLAVDAAKLGIWDWDVKQDRLVWDDSMYQLYGVHKDEFSGAYDAWAQCLVPEDHVRAQADIEGALRGERELKSDFRVKRADGAIRNIRAVALVIRNADRTPMRMVGINWDVTDITHAENEREQLVHELQRSSIYLVEAERLSQTGCWTRNAKTGELFWSAEEWRIFGLDPATTQLSYETFIGLIHPEDRAFVEEKNEWAIGNKKPLDIKFRAVLRDGTVKHLHSVGRPFAGARDGFEYIGVTTDETGPILANAAMHVAQAELARAARLTTMGELTASIAHEINQPLAAIVAYGNAALRWQTHAPPNLKESTAALSGIIKEAIRASEVIARIRTLLMDRKPEYIELDINEAIREVVALAMGMLQSRSITVRTKLPRDLPLALGDRVQLQQVIMNLIINGADAMNSNTHLPRVIWIRSKVAGAVSIQVAIRDSGTGIDEAIRNRIFDPLFTTKHSGMGMGLSICRSIIEAHGGQLWPSPSTPHGAEFQFTIPQASQPENLA